MNSHIHSPFCAIMLKLGEWLAIEGGNTNVHVFLVTHILLLRAQLAQDFSPSIFSSLSRRLPKLEWKPNYFDL